MIAQKLAAAAGSKISVTSTATSLYSLINTAAGADTSFLPQLNAVNLTLEDGDVRILMDGNTPTAANGLLLKNGTTYNFRGIEPAKVQLIRTGGSDVACSVEVGYTASGSGDVGVSSSSGGGGSGDVTGPASSTDNAVVRFDGTGGKTIQNSGVTIDDSDNLTVPGDFNFGDAAVDTMTAEGTVIIDVDDNEAFLVRKDGDAEDIFVINTNNGEVGVGGAPVAEKLHIRDAGSVFTHITNDSSGHTTNDGFKLGVLTSTSNVNFNNQESSDMNFFTSGSQRMALDDSEAGRLALTPGALTSGGTDDRGFSIEQTLNDSGAAGGSDRYAGLFMDITETDVTGWDNVYLMDLQVGAATFFRVDNSGQVTARADTDTEHSFGRFSVSTLLADSATIAHYDLRSTSGSYAVTQTAAGLTLINAATGQDVRLAIGGSSKWQLTGTTEDFIPLADNSYDLGGASNQVRTGYFGTSIINGGAYTGNRTAVADTDYTILGTDYVVAYTSLTTGRTATLPTAASAGAGRVIIVKDEAGTAGTDNITVDGNGAETIDGSATVVISANYGSVSLYCDGSNWFTI